MQVAPFNITEFSQSLAKRIDHASGHAGIGRCAAAQKAPVQHDVDKTVFMVEDNDEVAAELQHVRSAFARVHIILMTGCTEQLESIARLGFHMISKPCSADILDQVIRRRTVVSIPDRG